MFVDLVLRDVDAKLRLGDIDAAYQLCDEAIASGATSAALFAKRGQINRILFRNAHAIEDLSRAVKSAPSVNSINRLVQALETLVGLAETLKEAGESLRAIELLETYLPETFEAPDLYVVANASLQLGKLRRQIWQSDRAWRRLQTLSASGSAVFDAEVERARREMADLKARIAAGIKTIRHSGESPEALRLLAEHLCKYGKPKWALACLRRMAGGCERDPRALIVKFYAMLRLGSVADAAAELMTYQHLHQNDGDYVLCLAVAQLQLGEVEAAVAHLSALPLTALQGPCFDLLWRIQVNKRGDAGAVLALATQWASHRENSTAASQYLTALHLSGGLRVEFGKIARDQPGLPTRPKTIVQFWDRQPPADIVVLTEHWRQSNPDWTHRLFDDEAARDFLRSAFGTDVGELYAYCHHPAMKSDFFRIGYLLVHGGVYLDADEACLQPANAFFQGWENVGFAAVASSDTPFYIHNWFLCAAPGHAILSAAWELMTISLGQHRLQSRRGDIWQTTGPGLMTRAVARYVREAAQAAVSPDVTLITEYRFRQFAATSPLNYKATKAGNWRLA